MMPFENYTPEEKERLRRMERNRAMAEALLAQSLTPMGDTQYARGVAIKRSPLEGVAKLAQTYSANRRLKQADERESELYSDVEKRKADQYRKVAESFAPDNSAGTGDFSSGEHYGNKYQRVAQAMAEAGDYNNATKMYMKGMESPDQSAPTVKDFFEDGRVIQKQWDPDNGQWVEMGSGPRWNPNTGVSNAPDPYYQALQGVDENGKPYFYSFNARTGDIEPLTVTPGSLSPEAQGAVSAAKSEGTAVGKATGEAKADLADRKAQYDRLETVVSELSDLGKKATYTTAGRALDTARKELGMEPRESAIARKEYISKVDNEILPLLRQTFGAQFTEREGNSLKATLGDPNATPEEKDAVLRSFIATKKAQIETLEKRTQGQGVSPVMPDSPESNTTLTPDKSGGEIKFLGFE